MKYYKRLIGENGLINQENTENKIIVRDSFKKIYYCIKYKPLSKVIDSSKTPHLHEVILKKHNQKVRFDIDSTTEDYTEEQCKEIITFIIDDICIKFLDEYDIKINLERDILLCCSSDDYKISYHIIIYNYTFSNYELCKKFCRNICDKYPKVLDINVYKKIQNFRMLYSYKDERVKTPVLEWNFNEECVRFNYNDILYDSLITTSNNCIIVDRNIDYVDNDFLSNFVYDPEKFTCMRKVAEEWMRSVKIYKGYKYHESSSTFLSIRYLRIKHISVICPIHNRSHDNENIGFYSDDNNYYFMCYRSQHGERINIDRSFPKLHQTEDRSFGKLHQTEDRSFGKLHQKRTKRNHCSLNDEALVKIRLKNNLLSLFS